MSIAGGVGANTGGAVSVTSGVGTSDDSGSMTIATANSGSSGVSGDMSLTTGESGSGRRGRLRWRRATRPGGAGGLRFHLSVGDGNTGAGGAVTVTAGKTTADSAMSREAR